MKNIFLKSTLFFILPSLFILIGCDSGFFLKEIDPKDSKSVSELYVELFAEVDSSFSVHLSNTVPTFGAQNQSRYADKAKVFITDENGKFEIPFVLNTKPSNGFYFGSSDSGSFSLYKLKNKFFQAGKKYELEIINNGKTINESFVIPSEKPNFTFMLDSEIVYDPNYGKNVKNYFANISIETESNDDNLYFIKIFQTFKFYTYNFNTGKYEYVDYSMSVSQDDGIQNYFSSSDDLTSDGTLRLKRTLVTRYNYLDSNSNNISQSVFKFFVSKVDKSFYNYVTSFDLNSNSHGDPFSEPSQIKWNLKNVKGIATGINTRLIVSDTVKF